MLMWLPGMPTSSLQQVPLLVLLLASAAAAATAQGDKQVDKWENWHIQVVLSWLPTTTTVPTSGRANRLMHAASWVTRDVQGWAFTRLSVQSHSYAHTAVGRLHL
jgi:hypothetical protein